MIEVRANMSFGIYQAGRHYQLDDSDPGVQGLVNGKYFEVLRILEAGDEPSAGADSSGLDSISDSGVGKRKPGRPKKTVAGGPDGTGSDFRAESNPVHPQADLGPGGENGETGSSGGSAAGTKGNPPVR